MKVDNNINDASNGLSSNNYIPKRKSATKNARVEEKLNDLTAEKGKKSEKKGKRESDQAAYLKRKIHVDVDSDSKVDGSVPSTEVGSEKEDKQKKKRKDKVKQGKTLEDGVNVAPEV